MTTKIRKPQSLKPRVDQKLKVVPKTPVAKLKGSVQSLSVRRLRELFGVSRKTFARIVGFSERAIADWESDKPLSEACLQRMREMTRLQAGLAGVMQADFIGDWLSAPNDAFAGLKPIEIIERGEVDRLWRMIYQLESGMPT